MFDIIKQMLYLTALQQFNWAIIIMKSFFEDKKLVIISSKTIRLNSLIEINKSIRHEIKSIISHNESLAEYEKKKKVFFFYLSGFSFTDNDNSQDSRGREGTFFYSTLPLPPAHKHSEIYVQLCTWDKYPIFLISTLVFTRLLLDEIYHLIKLLFGWLMCYWFKFVCFWFD